MRPLALANICSATSQTTGCIWLDRWNVGHRVCCWTASWRGFHVGSAAPPKVANTDFKNSDKISWRWCFYIKSVSYFPSMLQRFRTRSLISSQPAYRSVSRGSHFLLSPHPQRKQSRPPLRVSKDPKTRFNRRFYSCSCRHLPPPSITVGRHYLSVEKFSNHRSLHRLWAPRLDLHFLSNQTGRQRHTSTTSLPQSQRGLCISLRVSLWLRLLHHYILFGHLFPIRPRIQCHTCRHPTLAPLNLHRSFLNLHRWLDYRHRILCSSHDFLHGPFFYRGRPYHDFLPHHFSRALVRLSSHCRTWHRCRLSRRRHNRPNCPPSRGCPSRNSMCILLPDFGRRAVHFCCSNTIPEWLVEWY